MTAQYLRDRHLLVEPFELGKPRRLSRCARCTLIHAAVYTRLERTLATAPVPSEKRSLTQSNLTARRRNRWTATDAPVQPVPKRAGRFAAFGWLRMLS